MTDKQKAARLKNLENGRKKRMELIKQKKQVDDEYDLSSNDEKESESSDSDDGFIISKKKPVKKPKDIPVKSKPDKLRSEVDELKTMIMELATIQKKQNKAVRKRTERPSGGTKIVVLPNHSANPATLSKINDGMELLRRSLGLS